MVIVALSITTQVTTLATTLVTLVISSSISPSILFPFSHHLRTIVSMNGSTKLLMVLTLYNYYFHLINAKNSINADFGYILILHDDYIPLNVYSLSAYTL